MAKLSLLQKFWWIFWICECVCGWRITSTL